MKYERLTMVYLSEPIISENMKKKRKEILHCLTNKKHATEFFSVL